MLALFVSCICLSFVVLDFSIVLIGCFKMLFLAAVGVSLPERKGRGMHFYTIRSIVQTICQKPSTVFLRSCLVQSRSVGKLLFAPLLLSPSSPLVLLAETSFVGPFLGIACSEIPQSLCLSFPKELQNS